MTVNRREFALAALSLPLTMRAARNRQPSSPVEPPILLWEMFSLIPTHDADGEPIRLTGIRGEMIFPGALRSIWDIPTAQARAILEADTGHMLDVDTIPGDDGLERFCGGTFDDIVAIGAFRPCTIFIGDFTADDVYAAWENIGYERTGEPDIWSWKGLAEQEMDAADLDAILMMQRRLTLPPKSRGHYRFLTLIDEHYIVEAESAAMLRRIRDVYGERWEVGSTLAGALGSVPASASHIVTMYEDEQFVTLRRPDSPTDRQNVIRRENEAALASIEDELGRMPHVQTALLGMTPGTPWRDPLDAATLPDIASTSFATIQLQSQQDADQYLAIATARFEALTSWYTETPYPELFSFEGNASGNRVSIQLGHLRERRYDVMQMAYFDDLVFVTWEPDDRETWRSAR